MYLFYVFLHGCAHACVRLHVCVYVWVRVQGYENTLHGGFKGEYDELDGHDDNDGGGGDGAFDF